jgi:hypothetical protein
MQKWLTIWIDLLYKQIMIISIRRHCDNHEYGWAIIMANTDKFKNKYRIPSANWASWDYSANAAYFVTICTAHYIGYFGTIVETQYLASLPFRRTQILPVWVVWDSNLYGE